MPVSRECFVLSGRVFYDGPIHHPEESTEYNMCMYIYVDMG
jgi:hypothetical protein